MMTTPGKIMFGAFGLVLIGCARAATIALSRRDWDLASTLYVLAVICLAGIFREISRAELHESGRPHPAWSRCKDWARAWTSPRVGCNCNRWWTSFGSRHDDWCPEHGRHYLADED